MKTKMLMSLAVASTLGWSAGAFAGSTHEVMTPSSANESGEVIVRNEPGFSGPQPDMHAFGGTSSSASGTIGGSYGSSQAFSSSSTMSGDEGALLSPDEQLSLGDQGVYSDYYIVSWAPAGVESWDYYIIPDQVSWTDEGFSSAPTHELALVPSSSDEMVYDLVLVPVDYDDMTASYSFDMDAGE
jgi:hypothetical protein